MAKKHAADANEGGASVAEMTDDRHYDPAESQGKTAKDLVAHLAATGTPFARMRLLEEWLKANKDGSADDLYRYMESVGSSQGTLRKAGKWAFGSDFEPEDIVKVAPADEMLRVRQENDTFRARIAELQADKLGLINHEKYLKDQITELTRKVQYLSMGKTRDELASVGL